MTTTVLDAVNYANGQKNNWRRTCWNKISEYLTVPTKDAVVLYLPGSTNLDEAVAIKKGFQRHNLIAVERDRSVCRFLRNKLKVNVIEGNLEDVLYAWPKSAPKVDVIVADFQCGMTKGVSETLHAYILNSKIQHSVLCLNAMRGRDKGDFLDDTKLLDIPTIEDRDERGGYSIETDLLTDKDDRSKHRGILIGRGFITILNHYGILREYDKLRDNMVMGLWKRMQLSGFTPGTKRYRKLDKETDREANEWMDAHFPRIVALPGYRSGDRQPFMDAVIIKSQPFGESWQHYAEQHSKIDMPELRPVKRRIAAALAIRTTRSR